MAGCAATHGTRPFDMSAPEHEKAAADASASAVQQALEADKRTATARYYRAISSRNSAIAAAHSDAARTLRTAQERACSGVSSRDIDPGVSGLKVLRVSRLHRPVRTVEILEGTGILVAIDGRTFDSFAQLMRCRAAHAAVTRDPVDPLAVAGAVFRVYRDDGDAAVVQIRASDPGRAKEIFRRVARQVNGDGEMTETHSADGEAPFGSGRSRSPAHDPRTHGSGRSGAEAPGGFAPPVGGPTRPGGRP